MAWLFLGAGNMASSLVGGLINDGESAANIALVDPDQCACDRAAELFGVTVGPSIQAVLSKVPDGIFKQQTGVVLAVKPHIVQDACHSITGYMNQSDAGGVIADNPLFISVAAGVQTTSLQAWLPEHSAVIRCMPNTPALLGLGATALFANSHCSEVQKTQAKALMDAAGITIWVANETDLDAVTAVSGSGPAYFFYLIEHMIDAATELGLDQQTAENLAIETAYGAASMVRTRERAPSVLRENVTSKGGTTAAALDVFNDRNMPHIIRAAMRAARDKAEELGRKSQ